MESPQPEGGGYKALPHFAHIHCSSRFDRSAASLESDMDDWMAKCSLVTVTEITANNRAATLRETGWGYYNHRTGPDSDNCGIAWEKQYWRQKGGWIVKLTNHPYTRAYSGKKVDNYAATVVLQRVQTGHKILVSVSHFPAHVEGKGHWRTDTDQWKARKEAYLTSLTNWATYVKNMERKQKTDAALIVADWNLNLKEKWVQDLLDTHWGKNYRRAWTHFPTSGGSLTGGPTAPDGSPGKGTHDRIIDGSLVRGLKVTDGPTLMDRVKSSDHRPYKETVRFMDSAEKPTVDETTGNTWHGEAWWGFGDYMDDEIYDITREFEET